MTAPAPLFPISSAALLRTSEAAQPSLSYARLAPCILLLRHHRPANPSPSLDLSELETVELAHDAHPITPSSSGGGPGNILHSLDPVRFARDVLHFEPDDDQAEFLRSHHPRVILNCCRQWGKSTVTAALITHRLLCGVPEALCVVVSRSERQSIELLIKVKRFAALAGVHSRALKPVHLEFPHQSRVVGLPASEETIRCFSAPALLIVDEAAKVPSSVFLAVRPMLATGGGRLILLSTPAGRRGFFYDIWASGAGASSGWERYAIPASHCPRISPAFLEEEKRLHGDIYFRQEYLCEFIDPLGQTFSSIWIAEALSDEVDII